MRKTEMTNKQRKGTWDRMLVLAKMLKYCKYTKELIFVDGLKHSEIWPSILSSRSRQKDTSLVP